MRNELQNLIIHGIHRPVTKCSTGEVAHQIAPWNSFSMAVTFIIALFVGCVCTTLLHVHLYYVCMSHCYLVIFVSILTKIALVHTDPITLNSLLGYL